MLLQGPSYFVTRSILRQNKRNSHHLSHNNASYVNTVKLIVPYTIGIASYSVIYRALLRAYMCISYNITYFNKELLSAYVYIGLIRI